MGRDGTAMHFDDRFTNCQSEPQTFALRIDLLERLKDFVERFSFQSYAAVGDFNDDFSWLTVARADKNRSIFRCELAGISKKIPKNLMEPGLVAVQSVMGCLERHVEGEMSLFNSAAHDTHRMPHDVVRVGRAQVESQPTAGDASEIKHVVDHACFKFHVTAHH